jgi:hypothetical protein
MQLKRFTKEMLANYGFDLIIDLNPIPYRRKSYAYRNRVNNLTLYVWDEGPSDQELILAVTFLLLI